MGREKQMKKVMAIIILVSLVITSECGNLLNIYAKETVVESTIQDDKKVKRTRTSDNVKEVKRLEKEKSENTDTYLLSDGLKRVNIYSEDVRFKENEKWIEYNTMLTDTTAKERDTLKNITKDVTGYRYVNKRGLTKQYFSKELGKENGIIMKKGNYSFMMKPYVEESYTSKIKEDEILYTSETSDIQYQYLSLKNGVKENIILNKMPKTNLFPYKLVLNGLTMKLNKKAGKIELKDGKNIVAELYRPNIITADGREDYEHIRYQINEDNNSFIIEIDKEYLEDKDTVYPITIDPQIVWLGSEYINVAGVWSSDFMADTPIYNKTFVVSNSLLDAYPYQDTENRVYVDTSNLTNGNSFLGQGRSFMNKFIDYAEFSFSETAKPPYYPTGTIQVKRALGDWDSETITWNTQPEISEDYIAEAKCTGNEGTRYALDITDWVQNIANGVVENKGLVFTCPQKHMAACIYGPEINYSYNENGYISGVNHMIITVTYLEFSPYDGSVHFDAAYDMTNKKIDITINGENKLPSGEQVTGYKVFERKDDSEEFSIIASGKDITEKIEITPNEMNEHADYRVCIVYSTGISRLSNIISFRKNEHIDSQNKKTLDYSRIRLDSDGDGLEDGYEIWDFNTKWNDKDEEGNYITDSDGDGLSDGYEVFYQGSNPAKAEKFTGDSDGDGLTDIDEFHRGTDPHLSDSDFDGINDFQDANPRKTDNPKMNGTDPLLAYNTNVYVGTYEKEYSEEKNGVKYSYIKNIYSEDIKQVSVDYGDSNLNKTIKYFYDANGNHTAIIEQYDSAFDSTHEKTICITYTYKNNDIEFICDQTTKYTMLYDSGKLKALKIGEQEIVNYNDVVNVDRTEEISKLKPGDIIKVDTNTINYKNNQSITTNTFRYKIPDNDFKSATFLVYIYYNSSSSPSYQIQYNIEGTILNLLDYTQGENPITYNYNSSDGNTIVTRSDGFTKSVTKKEEIDKNNTHITTTTTKYTYKDLKNTTQTKSSSVVSKIDKDNNIFSAVNMYSKDKYEHNVDSDNRVFTDRIYSDSAGKYILNISQVVHDNSSVSQFIKNGQADENGDYTLKSINYTYNSAGNITHINEYDEPIKLYSYDPHGRVTEETDVRNHRYFLYEYDTIGNVIKKTTYILNKVGELKETESFTYNNKQIPEQLSLYTDEAMNKHEITYDEIGNPIHFIDGKVLFWNRGRFLEKISYPDTSGVTYKYNENGCRTYKSTANSDKTNGITTIYEWDGNKLIKETNTNHKTNTTYEIWYLYDDRDNVIGYDHVSIDTNKMIKTSRVYYEKDIQGSVTGLWSEDGYRFASYSYDVWGNILSSTCAPNYTAVFEGNHITYKGYYNDNESGFYYFVKGYYVPKLGRMLNAGEPLDIIEQEKNKESKYLSFYKNWKLNVDSITLPTDRTGYDIDYSVDEYVEYCDTKSLLFESMNTYNTNCYGFAINCWTYKNKEDFRSGIEPGMFSGDIVYDGVYVPCQDIAKYVRQDMIFLGKDAVILTGSNNSPYYKTDDNHSLIAVRTMSESNFYNSKYTDYYHFMIRKEDGWYFKDGWKGGVFKLKGNNTPSNVSWIQYGYNLEEEKYEPYNGVVYDSSIQYIVIPKMRLQIQ